MADRTAVVEPQAEADRPDAGGGELAYRGLVPSPRQAEIAAAKQPRRGPTASSRSRPQVRPEVEDDPPLPALPLRAQVRLAVAQLNPRAVVRGYPVLPLIIFAAVGVVSVAQGLAIVLLIPNSRSIMGATNIAILGPLAAATSGAVNLTGPGLGYLADRYRCRVWFLRGGNILQSLAATAIGFSTGPISFISTVTGRGIGSILQGPAGSIPADYYPLDVRLKVGLYIQKLVQAATIVSAPVAGLIAVYAGWQWALILFGLVGCAVTGLTFLLKEPVQGAMDRLEAGADMETALHEQQKPGFAQTMREILSIRSVRMIYFGLPFLFATLAFAYLQQAFFADYHGLGAGTRGLIVSAGGGAGLLGAIAFTPLYTRLSEYKPGRLLNLAGLLLAILGVVELVMGLVPVLAVSLLCSLVAAFLIPIITSATFTIFQVVVPARVRTTSLEMIGVFSLISVVYLIEVLPSVIALIPRFVPLDPRVLSLMALSPAAFAAAYFISRAGFLVDGDIRNALAVSMADEATKAARTEGRTKMVICRDVDVTYDASQVLFNVDLDIYEGEIVALLGTNGAGKSTLLRAISGIQQASNGAIFLDGVDITHVPPHLNAANGVVMMPGGHAVFPNLTVEENLKAAAWLCRHDKQYVKSRVAEVLGYFPVLKDRLRQQAGTMSGGEQQMLALSQAFLMKPRLLMIDELSLGLAPQVVEMLLGIVRKINAQGTTVMLVEQSVNVALALAERAVFMEKGQIRFDGRTRDLLEHREILRSVFLGEARRTSSLTAGPRGISTVPGRELEREQVLTVEDARISFGGVNALNGVSFTIDAGEVVGIVGPNGAGKTTLFDAISGYVKLAGGGVVLAGNEVTGSSPDQRARLGLSRSFQNVRLFPALTVRENIVVALERNLESKSMVAAALWLPSHRHAERRARRRIDSLIESLGLEAYAEKFITELSTGTRRIVDIACILASTPKVLLLDEPSSGLAQAETEELGPFIGRISKDTGCAVLVIEHDLSLVSSVSDRLIAMRLGEVMMEGKPDAVLNDPAVSAALIGEADVALARSGDRNNRSGAVPSAV